MQMDDRSRRGLVFPLAFSALVVAVGIVGRLLVDAGRPMSPDGTPGKLLWVLAPPLLALIFRRLDPATRGKRFFRLDRAIVGFSARAAGLTAVAVVAVVGVGLALGATRFSWAGVVPTSLITMVASVALFAFFEESAWRGYLLPSLLDRVSYPVVIAISSVTWWAWHLPYLDQLSAVYTTESLSTLAPRLLLGVVAMQVLYTEVFLRCRSVWPAFAIHATFNVVANGAFLAGLSLQGSLGWALAPAADSVLMILATAAAGAWLYRVRVAQVASQ